MTLGWQVLVLAVDSSGGKVPPRNCPPCDFKNGASHHDMRTCDCLTCHGVHAATRDLTRLELMLERVPNGYLAVAVGYSDLLVLDVENKARGPDPDARHRELPTGVELVERWEELNDWSLPRTLTARSVSGGLHLFYRWTGGALPNVLEYRAIEVKTGAVYAAVPCGRNDRAWLDTSVPVVGTPTELVDTLHRSGRSRGRSAANGAPLPGGDGPLPDTDEFRDRGLGWFTGSRNSDAYRLAWRLWRLEDEREVEEILRACWEVTADRTDSSWTELWRTARSARRAMDEASERELAEAREFLRRFGGRS